jgi:hypothetical protein
MSLNAAMIYRRTDRGVREVYEKSHQFTQSERLILILLDGRLNVAGLQARLPSLNDERLERAMSKLLDARLVELMDPMHATSGTAPEAARLEPEAVAHFLEQTDLDPVTVFGDTDEEVATELVRASVEHAARKIAEEAAGGEQRRAAPATLSIRRARRTESGRSLPKGAEPDGDTRWDPTVDSHFAITTISVPDRLDLQEERDRAEMAEFALERRRINLRLWMKRLLGVAVVVVFVVALHALLKPALDETSAERVGARLSAVLKRPVTVEGTEFRLTPTPRLVVRGIEAVGHFRVDETSLLINWKDLWAAVGGGQWVWGEALVAPLTVTPDQALALARILPSHARELPATISTIRFQAVSVSDSRLMPGRYEAVLRRGPDRRFGPLTVTELDAASGPMRMQLRAASETEAVEFALHAERWALPVGPRVLWNEVRANGRLAANVLEVSDFTLAGFFGITTGTVLASADGEWSISGTAGAANIDVESIFQALRPQGNAAPASAVPLQGTASMNLTLTGRGRTLDDAISGLVVAGPFQLRGATLNGINLGLAAGQGVMAAGLTRFSEFHGIVAASSAGVRFDQTGGRAGAMAARSDFTVSPGLALAGALRVELGGQRVHAPISLRLRGTALEPRFGP